MHFFVAGGVGYIGSQIAKMLVANGYHVTVLANLSTGKILNLLNMDI